MFHKRVKEPEPDVFPERDNTLYVSVARELRKGSELPQCWFSALRDADPQLVESCLKKVKVLEMDPLKGLQRCLWIMLTAYRMQQERADQQVREMEKVMLEVSEPLGPQMLRGGTHPLGMGIFGILMMILVCTMLSVQMNALKLIPLVFKQN